MVTLQALNDRQRSESHSEGERLQSGCVGETPGASQNHCVALGAQRGADSPLDRDCSHRTVRVQDKVAASKLHNATSMKRTSLARRAQLAADAVATSKACSKCGAEKPLTDFHLFKKGKLGRKPQCKSCVAQYHSTRSTERRSYYRAYHYGISAAQFEALWQQQGGACAICGETFLDDGRGCHIDHCHVQNVVRGLLCNRCNPGIGYFQNDPEKLKKAIHYLSQGV